MMVFRPEDLAKSTSIYGKAKVVNQVISLVRSTLSVEGFTPDAVSNGWIRGWFEKEQGHLRLLITNGEVAGLVYVDRIAEPNSPHVGKCNLRCYAVGEGYRRQGVGSYLVHLALALPHVQEEEEVYCDVKTVNKASCIILKTEAAKAGRGWEPVGVFDVEGDQLRTPDEAAINEDLRYVMRKRGTS